MSGEGGCDVLGKKYAAGVDPEGTLDALGVELGEASRQVGEPELAHRLADAGQHPSRTRGPGLAVARQGERPRGRLGALAEIAPQPVPGGIGRRGPPGAAPTVA